MKKIKMKRISFFSALILSSVLLFTSCKNSDSQKKSATETNETAGEKKEAVTPDFRNNPHYVYCKIDGQPYLETNVYNVMNLPNRSDFHSTLQDKINGETRLAGMDFSFYTLEKVGAGMLTEKDFYIQGHSEIGEKYVSFKTGADQKLNLSSLKDGLLEGTFNFDVKDEKDPTRIIKITDGVFKMQIEGKTNLKFDKNGQF